MIIPFERLAADTLTAIVEEFINREGTDYGYEELSLEEKVATGIEQLRRKEVVIVFDPVLESTSIMTRQEAEQWESEQ